MRTRLLMPVLGVLACAATPPQPTEPPVPVVPTPAPSGEAPMPTPETQAADYAHTRWGKHVQVVAVPAEDVGAFSAFRLGDDGPFLFATDKSVLALDGTGDWTAFLATEGADARRLARAVVRMYADQMAGLLLPTDTRPRTVTPEAWANVTAPELKRDGGSIVLVFSMGVPPRFLPARVTVTAASTGPATITQSP